MGSKMIICLGYLCLQMAKGLWANSVTMLVSHGISVSEQELGLKWFKVVILCSENSVQ